MLHKKRKIDWGILLPVICFAIISIITISSALTYLSPTVGNLALKQAIWYVIGGVIIFVSVSYTHLTLPTIA